MVNNHDFHLYNTGRRFWHRACVIVKHGIKNIVILFLYLVCIQLFNLVPGANATVFLVDEDGKTIVHRAHDYRRSGLYFNEKYANLKKDIPKNFNRFKPLITQFTEKYNLSFALVSSIIEVESMFNDKIVSPKGAAGLMQLMPQTAERFGLTPEQRFTAKFNMDAGCNYLRLLLDTFKDTRLALAAYNAGENAVIKYNYSVPPYKETQRYVDKVIALRAKYDAPNNEQHRILIFDESESS